MNEHSGLELLVHRGIPATQKCFSLFGSSLRSIVSLLMKPLRPYPVKPVPSSYGLVMMPPVVQYSPKCLEHLPLRYFPVIV